MPRAGGQTRRGDGDSDGLGGQHAGLGLGLEDAPALRQGLVQAGAGRAEELARGGPVGLVERPDIASGAGQGGGVTGEGQAHLLEGGRVAGGGDGRQPLIDEGADARFVQRRQRVGSVSHPGAFR